MSSNPRNSPRTVSATLAAAVLGRPTAGAFAAGAIQLLLILLWHVGLLLVILPAANAIAFDAWKLWHAAWVVPDEIEQASVAFGAAVRLIWEEVFAGWPWLLLVVGLEGCIAYVPFRVVARRAPMAVALFVRCWWRSCVWGVLLVPAIAVLVGALPTHVLDAAPVELCTAAYLVLGPAWFAAGEQAARVRMARWRPVCPECGYSLRRLARENCPECGVAFPTSSRVYRRWANRRLAWDRLARGSLPIAYLKTVSMITFCPWRAARGAALPDRLARAGRWAVAHVFLTALMGLALGSHFYFLGRAYMLLRGEEKHWYVESFLPTPRSVATIAAWATQSWLAWLMAVAALPLLGVLLSAVIPGQHPAARRSIAKWSLYTAVTIPLVTGVCYAVRWLVWIGSGEYRVPGMPFGAAVLSWWSASTPPLMLLAAVYGMYWASGAAVNPYLRARGFRRFVMHAVLYIVSWLALAHVLFRPGALEKLL